MRPPLRSISFSIALALALFGCSQSSRPWNGPTASPSPIPTRAAPDVTGVFPSVASAGGGASVQIVGTGFQRGMFATFDGIKVDGRFDTRDTSFLTFLAEAPAHAIGAVDVVVTNPDGQSQRLAGRFEYAPEASFDVNGAWSGFSTNGTDTWVEFVIRDNKVISASCQYDGFTPFSFSEAPSVQNGEFSLTAEGGATLSGRIVSTSEMMGSIDFPACVKAPPLPWRVSRK
jgi:hypothetical protein